MHDTHKERRGILVVEAEEAFYELIQNIQSDRFSLQYAQTPEEALERVTATPPRLLVLESRRVHGEVPACLSAARARGVTVLALLTGTDAEDLHEDEVPLALFDGVASVADRPALMTAAMELLPRSAARGRGTQERGLQRLPRGPGPQAPSPGSPETCPTVLRAAVISAISLLVI